jgi:4'-phosphopantetheinyl transferase
VLSRADQRVLLDHLQPISSADVGVWIWSIPIFAIPLPIARWGCSFAEQQQACRWQHQADRQRFLVVRAALRLILGRVLDCAPSALTFVQGRYGKPELAAPLSHWQFNVSHAGDYGLIGLSCVGAIGVDVAVQDAAACADVAVLALSPTEQTIWQNTPDDRQVDVFYQYWCAKEAALKAVGLGIGQYLSHVRIGLPLVAGGEYQLQPYAIPHWPAGVLVRELSVAPAYRAAYALSSVVMDWNHQCR